MIRACIDPSIDQPDTLYVNVYLLDFKTCKLFNLVAHAFDEVISNSSDVDTVGNDHVKIDNKAVVGCL